MQQKHCSKCNSDKDTKEFSKDKNRKSGLYPHCKSCGKEIREYYDEYMMPYYQCTACKNAVIPKRRSNHEIRNMDRLDIVGAG